MADELIRCPSCDHALRLPRDLFGQTVECPQCGNRFAAPAPSAPSAVRAAGEPSPVYGGESDFAALRARQSARAPAVALLITSILGMGVGVLGLLFAGQIHANPNGFDADIHKALDDNPDLQPDQRITLKEVLTAENVASYTATCCGIGLVGNLAVMLGAIQMMRMRLYGFALLATVLALIPISPVCIVQAPFGIWGLIVLMDSNVRRSFA